MEIKEIQKKLKKVLDKDRYSHTIGVMYTAASLAMAHEYNIEKAMYAGLLHDCTKHLENDEQIRLCRDHNVCISDVEMENPFLLHQKTGAILAEEVYDIKDPEIIHAISVHTTGCDNMNLLDKIIFVADYIEPGRTKQLHLTEIRSLAFKDIDACIADILYDTLAHLKSKNRPIDSTTAHVYEYYRQFEREQPWKH